MGYCTVALKDGLSMLLVTAAGEYTITLKKEKIKCVCIWVYVYIYFILLISTLIFPF